MRLIPRDEKFFDMFNQQAANIHEAAKELVHLFDDFTQVELKVNEIKSIEHRGDQLTHDLMMKLNKTFITPFDREDIHKLASALDDVLDLVDAAAGRFVLYKVNEVTPGAKQLGKLILQDTDLIVKAVSQLHKPQNILEYCNQLTQIEKDGDRIKGVCIAALFENHTPPIDIIKWKEIYEVLESTTDKCEDVADVLEAVVLKAA